MVGLPEKIGKRLWIDEVALSQGELYTIVANKKAKGRVGFIVAIIATIKPVRHLDFLGLSQYMLSVLGANGN